jgi:hypothetical protein
MARKSIHQFLANDGLTAETKIVTRPPLENRLPSFLLEWLDLTSDGALLQAICNRYFMFRKPFVH